MTFISFILSIFTGEKRARKIVLWYNNFTAFLVRMRIEVEGLDNYDPSQSYVIVANHKSYADPTILWHALNADILWIMKAELLKIPFFGFIMRRLGNIGINRKNSKEAIKSISEAKKRLSNGTCVAFFPEGTRIRGNTIAQFKKGAFHFASELRLPVLPVSISGAENILPPGPPFIRYGKVKAVILKPIEITDQNATSLNEAAEKIRQQIVLNFDPDYK